MMHIQACKEGITDEQKGYCTRWRLSNYCKEEDLDNVLAHIEKVKQHLQQRGVPKEDVEECFGIEIVYKTSDETHT